MNRERLVSLGSLVFVEAKLKPALYLASTASILERGRFILLGGLY
jgi:hypothetical protein